MHKQRKTIHSMERIKQYLKQQGIKKKSLLHQKVKSTSFFLSSKIMFAHVDLNIAPEMSLSKELEEGYKSKERNCATNVK